MKRTTQQNRALHKWFVQLSEALNDGGYSIQETLSEAVDREWDETSVKALLWKPIQKAMLDIESTTEAETGDYTRVYEVLNRHLGEKFGIHVPFPSEETLSEAQR